jgi:hypothetical protein
LRWARDIVAASVLTTLVCVPALRSAEGRADRETIRRALASDASALDSLEQSLRLVPAESIRTADAVTALYLERLRLGLGSPFRLIEQMQRDPWLPEDRRRQLGHAMLERTAMQSGGAYQSDPDALALLDPEGAVIAVSGTRHAALIDSVVQEASDPRVGELTIRLAYRLAMASGSVARRAPEIATHAAAQVRDRVLAARDARLLLDRALDVRTDPLALIDAWRAEKKFAVERPVLASLSPRAQRAAVAALPATLGRIEQLESLSPAQELPTPRVPDGLARRMAGLAEWRRAPPQAPVAITIAGYGPLIVRGASSDAERDLRHRFVSRSRGEEALAAEYALLRARSRNMIPAAAAAVLTSGVALRPFAQERAWLAGDPAPSTLELQSRYGVASITFDDDVLDAWRPYYRRQLADAFADLRRVFPAFDVSGLHIRFGESPLKARALAMHDPVTRTVFLPVASSAGVIAHELAHDLDWQAARRRFGTTLGYRTDLAVRYSSDWLNATLRRMASVSRGNEQASSGRDRPTEIFARNVDWFVSTVLSRDERVNGYLSAVQDPVLIGYASATTPEIARNAGEATLRALDGMTRIDPGTRSWFDANYGAGRRSTVQEAIRLVLEAPVASADTRRADPFAFDAAESSTWLLHNTAESSAGWSCLLDRYARASADPTATRAVVQFAAEARARGIVRRWTAIGARMGSSGTSRLRALDGAPWDPRIGEDLARDLRDAILWRALRPEAPTNPTVETREDNTVAACGA